MSDEFKTKIRAEGLRLRAQHDAEMLAREKEKWQKRLDRQPCGCPGCTLSVQPGHLACSSISSKVILDMERKRMIIRAYDDGAWRWFIV